MRCYAWRLRTAVSNDDDSELWPARTFVTVGGKVVTAEERRDLEDLDTSVDVEVVMLDELPEQHIMLNEWQPQLLGRIRLLRRIEKQGGFGPGGVA